MFKFNKLNEDLEIEDYNDDLDNFDEEINVGDNSKIDTKLLAETMDIEEAIRAEIGYYSINEYIGSYQISRTDVEGLGKRNVLYVNINDASMIDQFLMIHGWDIYSKSDYINILSNPSRQAYTFFTKYQMVIDDAQKLTFKDEHNKIDQDNLLGISITSNRGIICLTYKKIVLFFVTGEVNYIDNPRYFESNNDSTEIDKLLVKSLKAKQSRIITDNLYFEPIGQGANPSIAEYRYDYFKIRSTHHANVQKMLYALTCSANTQNNELHEYSYASASLLQYDNAEIKSILKHADLYTNMFVFDNGKSSYLFVIESDENNVIHAGYTTKADCTLHIILNPN